MKFYQENKVNPFASCLPLVLQLPVFISLYYMLRTDLRHDICGIPARRRRATTNTASRVDARVGAVPLHPGPDRQGDRRRAGRADRPLRRLAAAVEPLMSATADKNAAHDCLALPFIFVPFVIRFPAGLLVYWITTNLWTVGQQYYRASSSGPLQPPRSTGRERRPPTSCTAAAADAANGARPPPATAGSQRRGESRRALGRAESQRDGAGGATREPAPPPPPPRRRRSDRGGGDERARTPRRPFASCWSASSRARPGRRRRGRRGRRRSPARVDGEDLGPVHRPPRPDDRRRAAPGASDRAAARRPTRAGRRRRRGLSRPPRGRRSSSRPTRPPTRRSSYRRAGRARRHDRDASASVVHEYLRDREGVETHSEGDEPDRHLVVAPLTAS